MVKSNIPRAREPITTLNQEDNASTQKTSPKKRIIWISLVSVACIVTAMLIYSRTTTRTNTTTPTYHTLLPSGSSIDELSGWKRVSPPEKDPVFAYTDTLDGVTISVSQQPLPDSFKTDTDAKVAELAKSYNATIKIETGKTTVYVGTSSKGPQSALFAKQGLLIMIKSQQKLSNDTWLSYVNSLN